MGDCHWTSEKTRNIGLTYYPREWNDATCCSSFVSKTLICYLSEVSEDQAKEIVNKYTKLFLHQ